MFCLNMMRIALELSQKDPAYQGIAFKFFEHFLLIGAAATNIGGAGVGLWDNQDRFYYDWFFLVSGRKLPVRLRSVVGLIPLFAVETVEEELLHNAPEFMRRMTRHLARRPELAALVSSPHDVGSHRRRLFSVVRPFRLKPLLDRMLDETEFLSPYGIRSISRHYLDHPYVFEAEGYRAEVRYTPAESDSYLFGGNSNWRGPIWMPINFLLIESLRKFGAFHGDDIRVECPKGSGQMMTLTEVSHDLSRRLIHFPS